MPIKIDQDMEKLLLKRNVAVARTSSPLHLSLKGSGLNRASP